MKNWRMLVAIIIGLNLLFIGWILVRQDPQKPTSLKQAATDLVSTETMEAAQYDLSGRKDELNIIVISIDSLRFDITGLGGDKRGLTQNIDRFAKESVVFSKATSAAPWTLPSHMSIWTARWPSVHQVTNKLKLLASKQMQDNALSPGIETYPDRLIKDGYVASGFTGGAGVQGRFGFGRDFQTYLDDRYFGGFDYSIPPAIQWIKDNRDKRFFMFLHGYDAHGQYELSDSSVSVVASKHDTKLRGDKEENAKLREQGLAAIKKPGDPPDLRAELSDTDAAFLAELYAAKVRDADQRVGNFLAFLRSSGLLDRSIVVLMSDHGDEFMEHGAIDHGATLYEEQLHVLMMIRFPGHAKERLVEDNVRTIDIFPTLFDALGIEGPSGADGKSLLPLLRGKKQDLPVYAETDYRLFRHLRAIRQGHHKLILDLQDGGKELYDLNSDPAELKNISSEQQRRTYEMEQAMLKWLKQTNVNPEVYLDVQQTPIDIF